MKQNKWIVAFWIAVVVAVIGWSYAFSYIGYFNQAIELASDAAELLEECVSYLK